MVQEPTSFTADTNQRHKPEDVRPDTTPSYLSSANGLGQLTTKDFTAIDKYNKNDLPPAFGTSSDFSLVYAQGDGDEKGSEKKSEDRRSADGKTESVQELLNKLGSSDYLERDQAEDALKKLGPSVLPDLAKFKEKTNDEQAYRQASSAEDFIKSNSTEFPQKTHFTEPYDADKAKVLIDKLGSNQFLERERAREKLEKMGPEAIPILTAATKDNPDPEIRKRAERLIEGISSIKSEEQIKNLLGNDLYKQYVNDPIAKGLVDGLATGDTETFEKTINDHQIDIERKKDYSDLLEKMGYSLTSRRSDDENYNLIFKLSSLGPDKRSMEFEPTRFGTRVSKVNGSESNLMLGKDGKHLLPNIAQDAIKARANKSSK